MQAFVQSKREIEGHIMLRDWWLELGITRANGWSVHCVAAVTDWMTLVIPSSLIKED